MNTLKEYDGLKKRGFAGFASRYLQECVESKSDNKINLHGYIVKSNSDERIDIQVYTKLVQLDSRLGTTASEQLAKCLLLTSRSDIIKVFIFALN